MPTVGLGNLLVISRPVGVSSLTPSFSEVSVAETKIAPRLGGALLDPDKACPESAHRQKRRDQSYGHCDEHYVYDEVAHGVAPSGVPAVQALAPPVVRGGTGRYGPYGNEEGAAIDTSKKESAMYQQPYPQMPRKAVSKERKRTSHGLHLFLTIITFGVWGLLVWFPLTIWHKVGPQKRIVTRYR